MGEIVVVKNLIYNKYKMYKKIVFILMFLLININVFAENEINISSENNDCINLLIQSNTWLTTSDFKDLWKKESSNDWITWIDFIENKIFEKQSYIKWEKSNLTKKDIFKIFDIYWIDLSNDFFYENEINLYDIKKDWKNENLYCSISKTTNINWKLSDLKNKDVNTAYSWVPNKYEIENIEYNWKNWKKLNITKIYKNRLWNKDVLKIESTYFIPENKNLDWYYNLYEIASKLQEINNIFSSSLSNLRDELLNHFVEIYNKDWIKIEQLSIKWTRVTRNSYWIKWVTINWVSFFNDYAEFKRHQLFEYLLENKSPLAKDIYIIENKWDEVNNTYLDPQINIVEWVLYFLWDVETLDKSRIDVVPYYLRKVNIINNSQNEISQNWVDRRDFVDYINNEVYWNNSNEQILKNISSEIELEDNFKYLITEHNNFLTEYRSQIEWKESVDYETVKDIYIKYANFFKNEILEKKEITEYKNELENIDLSIVNNNTQNNKIEKITIDKVNKGFNYKLFISIFVIILLALTSLLIINKHKNTKK